ncbi:hypothetical protein SADUNF_Sadunf12G0005900 [Salix dunnii]|uniref:Uncharacterized protein n=1 Tax=Salix dunnii TaxID=1413687 RepID=A0A835MNY2_9ROSI|nr:hypothetical protein SADUNF_Sadunf12G0005900 [Salix dunnii]
MSGATTSNYKAVELHFVSIFPKQKSVYQVMSIVKHAFNQEEQKILRPGATWNSHQRMQVQHHAN